MKLFKYTTYLIFLAVFLLSVDHVFAQTNSLMNFTGKITNTDGSEVADGTYNFSFEFFTTPNGAGSVWSETLSSSTCFKATITGVAQNADTITYSYDSESATTSLRIGQYLTNASSSGSLFIVDYDTGAGTVTVASSSTFWSVGEGINNLPFVEGGVIDMNLGSVTDMDSVDFSVPLYLEVTFNSEVMQPRKRMTTVAQSYDTINFGGKTESEYATLGEDESVTGEWSFLNIVDVATSSSLSALTVTQNGSGNIAEFKRGASTSLAILADGRVQFENYTFPLANGAPGYVLKATAGGQLAWEVDFAGSGGGAGLFASSTDGTYGDFVYQADAGMDVVFGNINLTGPSFTKFEVDGFSWFDDVGISQGQELRLYDTDSSNYVGLRSSSTVVSNFVLTLPADAGTDGLALVTDGNGNLRWASPSGFVYVNSGLQGQMPYYASDGSALSATSSIYLSTAGKFGLGTSTPAELLSIGATLGSQFLVNDAGAVIGGTWQGDVITVQYGGVGTSTFEAGSVLYAPSDDTVGEILAGTEGYVLKMSGGVPVWGPDSTVGGESILWATSSDDLLIRPTFVSQVVVIGAGATTSSMTNLDLEVAGNSYFGGTISAQDLTLVTALTVGSGGTGTSTPGGILLGDGAGNIVSLSNNSSDWNTAYSWGDHSIQNYFDKDIDVLVVDEGGTGTTTFQANALVFASALNTIGEIPAGAEGEVLKVVGGIPTWSATSSGGAHPLLSTDHSDATANAVLRGALITGQGASPTWSRLALGAQGYILRSDGTDMGWSTTTAIDAVGTLIQGTWQADVIDEIYGGTGQTTWNQGDLVFATSSDDIDGLPIGTSGYILQVVNGFPSWQATSSLGIDINSTGGVLSVDKGGTGQDFSTDTGFLYFDNGLASASTTIAITYTDLSAGSGINMTGNTITLDRTGDWTGTFDGLQGSQVFLLADWYATTTDALPEGLLNKYYNTGLFAADLNSTTTDAISEGAVNQYYHSYLFASDLSGTTTDAMSEGSNNLYWTQARFDTAFGLKDTDDLTEGVNKFYSTLLFAADLNSTSTDALSEGSNNLYWTQARFDARLNATTSLPNLSNLSGLSTVGTITSGTWNGSTIDVTRGGTGITSVANQSLLYASSANTIGEFTVGAEGEVLVVSGGNLTWASTSPAAVHGLLSVTHNDVDATSTLIRGDIIVANSSNEWSRLGLGTQGYVLYSCGTDAYWSTTTAITSLGIVTQGTWRGDAIEMSFGGTGATTATGARANLDLDEVYKFGINATGTNGEVWVSDGDGRGHWLATSSLGIVAGDSSGSKAIFVGTTTVTSDGSIATGTLTGYAAANDICKAEFSDSFFCRTYDIISSVNESDISSWGDDTSSAWIAEGPPGYTSDSNDCSGWTNGASDFLGAYWKFNYQSGGTGWLIHCGNLLPITCCEWQ